MRRSFYRCLLWLHPAGFRDRFTDEMLWIFDETGGQGPRPFTDVLISLLRQWTFHAGVWRIAFGALASCLLLAGWWHFQEAALASALRRGNPGALTEIKHRHASGMPCVGVSGDVALLYLGPPETLTRAFPPAASLEPTYMKELDRRSMIEWGELRDRKFLGAAAE